MEASTLLASQAAAGGAPAHPWTLLAPWWRWQRQNDEEGRAPRATRPVFQKYDNPDFINVFLKEPQRSLKFFDDVDRVFRYERVLALAPTLARFQGKRYRLFSPTQKGGGDPKGYDVQVSPTGIRKLFLETHQRFYLVVCELHCDRPGLPTAPNGEVCQSGLVVRRRRLSYPAGKQKEAAKLLKEIAALRAELGHLDQQVPLRPFTAGKRTRLLAKMRADGSLDRKRAELHGGIAQKRAQLLGWQAENGVVALQEGWIPDAKRQQIGAWEPVEDKPQQLDEAHFPLYHLFPDPRRPDHDGHGKTVYFGIVPVGGGGTDARGEAHFDDQSLYEVRCFVRRHKPGCPRQDEAPDCHGELVWSEPTESYKLANQNDLQGTAQRPVTVQVPSFDELAAQVAALPFGKASPVKVVQPDGLHFGVDTDAGKATGPSVGGVQICFFAIPLITIVALFLLKLFLPIVVFLFGLYFLLALKFCIPPSLELDAALQAELAVPKPGIDVSLDFDFDADFSVNVGGQVVTEEALHASLATVVGTAAVHGDMPGLTHQVGSVAAASADLQGQYSNKPMVDLHAGLKASADASFQAQAGPDLNANIDFEPRVTTEVKLT